MSDFSKEHGVHDLLSANALRRPITLTRSSKKTEKRLDFFEVLTLFLSHPKRREQSLETSAHWQGKKKKRVSKKRTEKKLADLTLEQCSLRQTEARWYSSPRDRLPLPKTPRTWADAKAKGQSVNVWLKKTNTDIDTWLKTPELWWSRRKSFTRSVAVDPTTCKTPQPMSKDIRIFLFLSQTCIDWSHAPVKPTLLTMVVPLENFTIEDLDRNKEFKKKRTVPFFSPLSDCALSVASVHTGHRLDGDGLVGNEILNRSSGSVPSKYIQHSTFKRLFFSTHQPKSPMAPMGSSFGSKRMLSAGKLDPA